LSLPFSKTWLISPWLFLQRRARFGDAAPIDPEAAAAAAKAQAQAAAAEAEKKARRAAKFGLEVPDPSVAAAAKAEEAKAALLGQLKLKPHQVFDRGEVSRHTSNCLRRKEEAINSGT